MTKCSTFTFVFLPLCLSNHFCSSYKQHLSVSLHVCTIINSFKTPPSFPLSDKANEGIFSMTPTPQVQLVSSVLEAMPYPICLHPETYSLQDVFTGSSKSRSNAVNSDLALTCEHCANAFRQPHKHIRHAVEYILIRIAFVDSSAI